MKIHYKGFSEEADEWREYEDKNNFFPFVWLERLFIPQDISLEDRMNSFHDQVYKEIKCNLRSGQRDDPEVMIEGCNVDFDVFHTGLGRVVKEFKTDGKRCMLYQVIMI